MEHHFAQDAGDELGAVVALALAGDDDALEVVRAARALQVEDGIHGAVRASILYGCTVCEMNRDADNLADVQWLALCARRLRQQWPRADVTSIDETALELWGVEALRELTGEEAAARWLEPLQCGCGEMLKCSGSC